MIDDISQMVVDMIPQVFEGIAGVNNATSENNVILSSNFYDANCFGGSNEIAEGGILSLSHEPRPAFSCRSLSEDAPSKRGRLHAVVVKNGEFLKKAVELHSLKKCLIPQEYNTKILLIERQREIIEEERNLKMEI